MSRLDLIRHGSVAELHLNNPAKLNAFTREMLESLDSACAALEDETEIRAIIVTSAPARAFCSGADVAAWSTLSSRDFPRRWVRGGHRTFDRFARLSKPTIAAISGDALGGGLEFAAACDLRLMAPTASLALPETRLGIVPGWSGTQRLIRLIGEPAVKEMALLGRRLPAERALALGFVAEIATDPRARAIEIAENLSEASPRAVEVAKYMIHAAVDEDRAAMIETLGAGVTSATADRDEGVAAFREKRKPNFTGK